MKHTRFLSHGAKFAGILAAGTLSAQAQTAPGVTFYGVMDAGIASFSRSASVDSRLTKVNSDASNSSVWGLRGSEDLGGGMAALFGLESMVSLKSGDSSTPNSSGATVAGNPAVSNVTFRRAAYVGMKSKSYGSVMLGRNYTATAMPQLVNATGLPNNAVNTGLVTLTAAQGINNDYWNSNMVRYDSPVFSGFNFALQYVFGEDPQNNSAGSGYGGLLSYTSGPFKVVGTYNKDKGAANAANTANPRADVGKSIDWWMVSGSYDVGQFRLSAAYDEVKNDDGRTATLKGGAANNFWIDSKMWTVGGNYAITPQFRLGAQYGEVKETWTDTKSKQTVLSAHYAFSKRTNAYLTMTHTSNGNAPILPIYGNPQTNVSIPNHSVNAFVLGMVHRF